MICDREMFARMTGQEPTERTFRCGTVALWCFGAAEKAVIAMCKLGRWEASVTTATHTGHGTGATMVAAIGQAMCEMKRR